MHKKSVVEVVAIDRLVEHSAAANEMPRTTFLKLVRNIGATGRYAPLIVRRHPEREGIYQVIDGHQRLRVLRELGYGKVDLIVWDPDDDEMDILLATLNRLRGKDKPSRRIKLLKRLRERRSVEELGRLLPERAGQIERLLSAQRPAKLAEAEKVASPVVFFVDGEQKEIIAQALANAERQRTEKTKAGRRAAILAEMAASLIAGKTTLETD